MTNETTITISGNLTAAPELRHTQAGVAVADLTIATTDRILDRTTNQWRDGDTLFLRCTAWRDLAENLAASLTKGSRIIANGRLKQRSYEDREGITRTTIELEVDDIGASLKRARVEIVAAPRVQPVGVPAAGGDIPF